MTSNELFEEILPLAPLQEGMLFHATYDEDALDVYTVRLAVDFEGPFDIATFREAVRALLVRRNNLRAGFLSENLSKPVQVIPREFETPVVVHDLSGLPQGSRESRLAELAAEEEAVRFDLANPPLLRFTVVRLAERGWRLMFSCHHILLDGWSMPLVLGELFELYQREGDASGLPDATPFKLYLAWLRKQDKETALDAWRTALEGLPGPTKVAPEASDTVSALPGGTTVDLPEEQSAALTALARRLGVTVNTVVQVGWGLLLSRLTDRRDLVFGATVSGRPAEIEGVESIVGLFINTVPVRMRLDAAESLRELLIRVQDEQSALLDHHYVGLTDIQRAAGHNGLFDSMVAFESYPVDEGLKGSLGELTITGVSGSDATHYPLTLIVVPGDRLQLRLGFRQNLFTEETAGALLGGLEQLLSRIATDDGAQAEEAAAAVELPEGWTVAAADSAAASGSSVSDLTAAPGGGRAARTPHEEVLCGLFAEALGVASVSIDDNFFDLGGHSLMATKLVSRIRSVFEIELPVRALFDAQTVAALAERVSGSVDDGRSAIQPVERPEQIPLSFAQRRLWFLNRMEGPGATYNIPLTVRLTGPLNHTALRHALRDILHRHETLRTTYPDHDGQPWQHITPTTHTTLPYTTQTTTEATLEHDLNTLATTGFDLTTQLPIRITLLQITPTDHILNLTIHHIATDGWSQAPLAQDLTTAYTAHTQGTTPNWTPLPVQYADYALWQHDTLGNENDPDSPITTQLNYWRNTLNNLPDELNLPTDRPRPTHATYQGATHTTQLPPRLHNDLQNLARTTRSSLFMVLQTGITGLLNKLGAGTDIPLGTAIAGRTDTALDNLVGFFINTLVLRTDASGDPTFRELLNRTRTTDLTAYNHQDLPFEQLVHALQPTRSLARHPLFQVMLVLQNNTKATLNLPHLTAQPLNTQTGAAKFDLGFNFIEEKGEDGQPAGIEVTVEYATDLFDEETVERLTRRLGRLLSLAVADPEMPISQFDLLEPDEWQRLTAGGTGAQDAAGTDDEALDTVAGLFAKQAALTPARTAIVAADAHLTYAELDARSTRLATHLTAHGVQHGDTVAIAVPRSAAHTVAHLAVLRAGAVCLPLETDHPAGRIARLLDDTAPVAVLTTRNVHATLPETDAPVVVLDDEETAHELAVLPADPTAFPAPLPDSPAYLLHPSGSAGRPKGVLVPHRGIANRLRWMRDNHELGAGDRVLYKAPADLDVSVWELLSPLVAGAVQIVAEPGSHRDPARLAALIERTEVTCLHFAPSLLREFLAEAGPETYAGLRRVFLSGEPLATVPADELRELLPHAEIHLLYGATEASFDSLARDVRDAEGAYPAAGRLIRNTRAHVLDSQLSPMPTGSAGELYLGGAGLAHGYLGRPALTAERFVADPYGPAGSRLYRTGDLARITRVGTVELIGRTDDRITIGGRHVEPAEVERVLALHRGVDVALVTTRPGPSGEVVLVAYHTPIDPDAPAEAEALRTYLAQELPDYTVPAHYVSLAAFPRLEDGGIDHAELPEPRREAVRPPRNDIEQTLCDLFSELLGKHVNNIDDSFFDLGGHSLLATKLVSRVRSTFSIELPFRDIFDAQTVAALAERVSGSVDDGRSAIQPVERPEQIPLSFAQRRLWFLNRMEGPGATYNIPLTVRLTGPLNHTALRHALRDILHRHETLRTTYPDHDGQPWQHITPTTHTTLPYTTQTTTEATLEHDLNTLATTGFDLTTQLPIRITLLQITPTDHILNLTIHHIATDGWSQAPLAQDLTTAYTAHTQGTTPNWTPLPVQYADYALWQHDTLGNENDPDSPITTQLNYWRNTLNNLPDELNLPTDRPRPTHATYQGATHTTQLPPRLHNDLQNLARTTRSSLFMVLQTGITGLLNKLGAGTDIPLGTAIAGRTDTALDNLVGFFINTLVLRTDASGDPTFRELLNRTRTTDLTAYNHQDLPFEQLVHALQPTRSLARHPLFQVMLVLQNNTKATLNLPHLTAQPLNTQTGAAKFDLGFNFIENKDEDGQPAGIDVQIEYSVDLFDHETVEQLAERLIRLLSVGAGEPETPLSRIGILEPAEREQLLNGWNDTARALDLPEQGTGDHGFEPETIAGLFADQAARTPGRSAIVAEDAHLTYAELDARSTRLATHLVSRGVRRGDTVAVAVPRSAALTVALLAVVKTGAAYLPIETDYPSERIAYMLTDAAPAVVLTTGAVRDRLPEEAENAGEGAEAARTLIVLDDPATAHALAVLPADAGALAGPLPDSPAYLLYTSGSTGRPKGVLVPHRGIVNRLLWMQDTYRLGADDRVLQKTPSGFDVSVWEFFWPLITGAVQVAARPGGHRDPRYLAELIQEAEVTTAHFVPSMLEVFLASPEAAECTGLRRVVCSGEALPAGLRDRFRALLPAELHNLYGPTEASVDVTAWDCAEDADAPVVPIGRPVWNTRTYVLDGTLAPAPVGSSGELYLGGVQLAHGYLGRPALTAERFVADPYGPAGSRLYRTGDLARVTRAGVLEFLGRTDDQIKIRGRRVELGEIEHAVSRYPTVGSAIVVAHRAPSGDTRLAAYVTDRDASEPVDLSALRDHLATVLIDHMVPVHYTRIDEVPLTPNGKVDKKALPAPEQLEQQPGRAPRNETETALCEIFAELLGHESVTIDDNFFTLGGHSLLATRLASRIKDRLDLEMSVVSIFEAPTVAALAVRLGQDSAGGPLSGLLPLRAGGTQSPLFCVHPLGGLSWPYAGIAEHLPAGVGLFGLQASGLSEGDPLPQTLEAMAAEYVARIRTVQEQGPYRLLGWSLGGRIAHAMAALLEEAGQEVELLALLDAYPQTEEAEESDFSEADFLKGILAAADLEPSALGGALNLDTVMAAVRAAGNDLAGMSADQLRRLQRVMANSYRVDASGLTGRTGSGAVMFAATTDQVGDPEDWREHLGGELEVHPVDASHNDLMRPEPLAEIGAVLAKKLAATARVDGV